MSDPVIELKGLKKDYGNGRGVFDVSTPWNAARCSASWGRTAPGKP